MTADDVATVRAAYEAMSRGELEPIGEMLDPDVEWRNPADAVEPGTRRGREEFVRVLEGLLEMFAYAEIQPEQIVEIGDRIAVVLRIRATGRGSGAPANQHFGHLLTMREGRLRRLEWFNDPRQAFEAAERAG